MNLMQNLTAALTLTGKIVCFFQNYYDIESIYIANLLRRLQFWLFFGVQMSQFYGLCNPSYFKIHLRFFINIIFTTIKPQNLENISIFWDWHGQTLASNSPFGYKFDWSWAFLGYCIFKYFLQRSHTAPKRHLFQFSKEIDFNFSSTESDLPYWRQ